MYRETIVKKPRKIYTCETCGADITGEHIYTAQVWDGDFHTRREHIECVEYRKEHMCVDCDCEGLSTECFYEKMCRDCKRGRWEDELCDRKIHKCIIENLFTPY